MSEKWLRVLAQVVSIAILTGAAAAGLAMASPDDPLSPGHTAWSPSPTPTAERVTYHVWTWNLAGWTMHRGSVTDGLVTVVSKSVQVRADFAAVSEVCLAQYEAIRSSLINAGWPQDAANFSRFEPYNTTSCGGEPHGVALFSKAPLGPEDRFELADDGSTQRRKLLCAPLVDRPKFRFCTVHITPSNGVIDEEKINEQQLDEVRTVLDIYHTNGDTVIIAGDFNAQPHYGRLDEWYSSSLDGPNNGNNFGLYRELDDTDERCPGYGEQTTEDGELGPCGLFRKIDLIFVREDRIVGDYSSNSLTIATTCGGRCSDHRAVLGTVTVSIAK